MGKILGSRRDFAGRSAGLRPEQFPKLAKFLVVFSGRFAGFPWECDGQFLLVVSGVHKVIPRLSENNYGQARGRPPRAIGGAALPLHWQSNKVPAAGDFNSARAIIRGHQCRCR